MTRLFYTRSLLPALSCLLVFLFSQEVAHAAPAPRIGAKRAIVVDYDSGRIMFQKNAHEKCAVASTQKLLTALCVLDAGSIKNKVTVEKTDTYCEPTKLYISPGQVYTRHDLVKALVVKSGNDIARALARDVSGSQAGFASYMNKKARQMGMMNSNFVNPNGLPAKDQYSTAYDVAIMARNAYSRPTLRSFMSNKGYYFEYSNGKKAYLKNTNRLLRSLPFCNGMKTGTTNAAGRCLVASGTLNGRTVIVVCLGATSQTIWKDSESLLRWGLVH